jgi:hypothetical protein
MSLKADVFEGVLHESVGAWQEPGRQALVETWHLRELCGAEKSYIVGYNVSPAWSVFTGGAHVYVDESVEPFFTLELPAASPQYLGNLLLPHLLFCGSRSAMASAQSPTWSETPRSE